MFKLTLFGILFSAFITGCSDEATTVYVHDLGSYRGKVAQYGVDGQLVGDQSGASVVIEGTAFKSTTDVKGEFEIKDVPAGIYSILITKPGFDTAITRSPFSGAGVQWLPDEWIQRDLHDSLMITDFSIVRGDTFPNGYLYHINLQYQIDAIDYGNILWAQIYFNYPNSLNPQSRTFLTVTAASGIHTFDTTIYGLPGDTGTIRTYFANVTPNVKTLKPYSGRIIPKISPNTISKTALPLLPNLRKAK